MRNSLVCLLFGLSPGMSSVADTFQIDLEVFDATPGRLISFEMNGETSEFLLRSRTETADHFDLILGEPGQTQFQYAGRLQLTRDNHVHFEQHSTRQIYQGILNSTGTAELSPGKLLPFSFNLTADGCDVDDARPTQASPMISSYRGKRFSLDTDIVRAAEPCTVWHLETPTGKIPMLITEVSSETPSYVGVSGFVIGSESGDHYGRPRRASLTVNDPCYLRDEGTEYCWQLILFGQTSDKLEREDDTFVTANATRREKAVEIVVSKRPPPNINLLNDVRWVTDD